MKFNYKNHIYIINLKKIVFIEMIECRLLTKRFLRACKRVINYSKNYFINFIAVILFEIMIIRLGLELGKYDSFIDGIWDMSTLLITSILVPFIICVWNSETDRHLELKKQFNVYQNFKSKSEDFIISLCNVINYEIGSNIFLSEDEFDNFYSSLKNKQLTINKGDIAMKSIKDKSTLYSMESTDRISYLNIIISKYMRSIEETKQQLFLHDFIGTISHAISQLSYIYDELEIEKKLIMNHSMEYSDYYLCKFINSISRSILPAIADIRRPWGWDKELDKKIKKVLDTSNKVI